jgi:hypothetical protein
MPFKPRDSRLWKGPGVEEKADRQFFRIHTDEEIRAFSSSVSVEDDVPEEKASAGVKSVRGEQARWVGRFQGVMQGLASTVG